MKNLKIVRDKPGGTCFASTPAKISDADGGLILENLIKRRTLMITNPVLVILLVIVAIGLKYGRSESK